MKHATTWLISRQTVWLFNDFFLLLFTQGLKVLLLLILLLVIDSSSFSILIISMIRIIVLLINGILAEVLNRWLKVHLHLKSIWGIRLLIHVHWLLVVHSLIRVLILHLHVRLLVIIVIIAQTSFILFLQVAFFFIVLIWDINYHRSSFLTSFLSLRFIIFNFFIENGSKFLHLFFCLLFIFKYVKILELLGIDIQESKTYSV